MVASQQHYLLGVFEFESHEQTDDLEGVLALVDVVTQEQVIISVDITGVDRSLPDVEESHQVNVGAVEVTHNLSWRPDVLDHDWLSEHNLSALGGKLDDVFSLAGELLSGLDLLAFLGLEQWLEEHLAESIVGVLVNL